MAPSGSKNISMLGEGSTGEGKSMASSSSGTGQLAKEDSIALSKENTSAREEHPEDGDWITFSAPKSKRPKGNSEASSSSGTGQPAKEGSEALSNSGEGASGREEYPEDGDSTTCSAPKSKRARRAVTHTISLGTKLDVGMWSMLDDHLVEKILARMSLKSLFQVSSLSKTWRARFGSHSFQSEVYCSSSPSSWNSYTPLFVNHKKDLVGYENSSKQWHRLPTHSYLRQNVVRDWSLKAGTGSLLCWTCPHASDGRDEFDIHVTNPLTKSWKQLPTRPKMHFPHIVHVGCERESKAYKVIVGTLKSRKTLDDRSSVRVQIFDSNDDSWIMESYKTVTNCAVRLGGSAFRDGVLYVLLYTLEKSARYTLISFDVKGKMWNEIPDLRLVGTQNLKPQQHLKFCFAQVLFSQVFSCRSDVMLVLQQITSCDMDSHSEDIGLFWCVAYEKFFSVFRLDLQRGLAFEVSRVPDSDVEMPNEAGSSLSNAAGQDDCIYIGGDRYFSGAIYNVRTRQWQLLNPAYDWSQSSQESFSGTPMHQWQSTSVVYQPGLNPFLEV